MRRRRVMLASKRQVNLIYKGRKVFQLFPLHFIAESAIEYLATLLVREFACFLFVSGGFRAVLPVKTAGIPLTVDKEFAMVTPNSGTNDWIELSALTDNCSKLYPARGILFS